MKKVGGMRLVGGLSSLNCIEFYGEHCLETRENWRYRMAFLSLVFKIFSCAQVDRNGDSLSLFYVPWQL